MLLTDSLSLRAGACLLVLALLSTGCARKPETGPGEVRWDRQICARCSMVISERNHAAQVRGGPEGRASELSFFDDIGCAVVWLDERAWKSDPGLEVWVAGHEDGAWLDARKAWFATGVRSPMDYELGARAEAGDGLLGFDEAREHVRRIEARHPQRRGRGPAAEGSGQ